MRNGRWLGPVVALALGWAVALPVRADTGDSADEAIAVEWADIPSQIYDGRDTYVVDQSQETSFDRIQVMVTVDRDGHVVRAVATEGNRALFPGAEAIALGTRFLPSMKDGKPVFVRFATQVKVLPRERRPTRHVPFPDGALGTVKITLERGICMGQCPIYTAEIDGAGHVVFTGEAFVAVAGPVRFDIPPAQVADLVEDFRAADFFSLDDHYNGQVEDVPSSALSVTIDGRAKTVKSTLGRHVGMPRAVDSLADQVDTLARAALWTRFSPETLTALRAMNWDLTTPAMADGLACAIETIEKAALVQLLDAGVPLNGVCGRGIMFQPTALASAILYRRPELVPVLLDRGAMQDIEPELQLRTFCIALLSGDVDIASRLLTFRPPLDESCLLGSVEAPLDYAVEKAAANPEYRRLVGEMLEAGADPNCKFLYGYSPLYLARDVEMVNLLVRFGAEVNIEGHPSSLLFATKSEDVALALIAAGADLSGTDAQGRGVADVARERGWAAVLARIGANAAEDGPAPARQP